MWIKNFKTIRRKIVYIINHHIIHVLDQTERFKYRFEPLNRTNEIHLSLKDNILLRKYRVRKIGICLDNNGNERDN